MSINQINQTQFLVTIENSFSDNIFSYPGFILFNMFGEIIALESVEYFGIVDQSTHLLQMEEEDVEITENLSLQLYTNFYQELACAWSQLNLDNNCDLEPDPGICLAAIETYYFNQNTGQCELTWWGGCAGVVPFWTMEDCQNSCQPIALPEINSNKILIKQIDLLGRSTSIRDGFFINIYNDGSVQKEFVVK